MLSRSSRTQTKQVLPYSLLLFQTLFFAPLFSLHRRGAGCAWLIYSLAFDPPPFAPSQRMTRLEFSRTYPLLSPLGYGCHRNDASTCASRLGALWTLRALHQPAQSQSARGSKATTNQQLLRFRSGKQQS